MFTWPLRNSTPGALFTTSSTVLTARRAISESDTRATLVTAWSRSCERLAAVTMTGSRLSGLARRIRSTLAESPAATSSVGRVAVVTRVAQRRVRVGDGEPLLHPHRHHPLVAPGVDRDEVERRDAVEGQRLQLRHGWLEREQTVPGVGECVVRDDVYGLGAVGQHAPEGHGPADPDEAFGAARGREGRLEALVARRGHGGGECEPPHGARHGSK